MIIIVGDKYRFIPLEISILEKLFGKIVFLPDIKRLPKFLEETQDVFFIVDNCKNKINIEINPDLEIIPVEEFLEKFLHKIYLPQDEKEQQELKKTLKPLSKFQYLQKRISDFILVFILFILSSPIILYSIYRIKKESPEGPILYKQKRVGKDGKEFVCYKFRSMIPDAEKGKPQFASENDPRVFRWGAFMRKTRIDELPQMWNVLKGDMHMIGPRPERKYWVDKFKKNIPLYDMRHVFHPGITGWAQVNYPYGRDENDAKQKLMYDLYYIKNWSILLDIKIVLMTIKVILQKKGS